MPSEWKESKLRYKYTELPDEPRYKKKKSKKRVIKSNHKHHYENCLFKTNIYSYVSGKKVPYMYGGVYCTICGKIGNITIGSKKVVNENLPIFDISDKGFFAKEIDLSGANIS